MARGKARKQTPEQIDREAEITEADIQRAREWWRNNTVPRFSTLLDSSPTKNGTP